MKITQTSQLTNITRTKELDITEEQYNDWKNGMVIQKAIPDLSPADREFMITGVTQEEWDKYIVEDYYEDDDMYGSIGKEN